MSQGKVIHVDDGDTVTLLAGGNFQIKVRLASIDAPESDHEKQEAGRIGQPYSQNSKQFLSSLVKGRTVDAKCYESDRYGRQVCDLFLDGQNVNARMVREGWAWANEAGKGRFLRDKSLLQAQADAKAARRGLWAGAHPVEPWEWRKTCWEGRKCPN
jgi:micrococcal nuclease